MPVTEIGNQLPPQGNQQVQVNQLDPEMSQVEALQAILAVLNVISVKLSLAFNLPEDDTAYSANPTILNIQP